MKYLLARILSLGVLLCVPSLAQAQLRKLDPFMRTVQNELRRYEAVLDVEDLTHEVWYGELRDDATTVLTVTLDEDIDYLILGVCDEDCDDLDLRLYSGTTLIDEDVATDDYPVVEHSPSITRELRLEVIMAGCEVSPCRYGVAVYEK